MKDVKRKPKDDTSSILTVLAADAQQSAYLKHLLTTTSERLQIETQRAVQAEQVLQQSETRAREAIERAVAAERARHVTEIENARLGEETKRYKLHVDFIEQELRRTVADMQSLETQLEESKRVASRSRRLAEQYKDALTESRAREEGREEGKRIGLMRGYSDGRLKGWQAGKSEGFAQGRSAGIEQGRQEGEEVGRMDERERALQAFDRFLAGTSRGAGSRSEMSEASGEGANVVCKMQASVQTVLNVDIQYLQSPRTRQWVNSPGQTLQEMSNIGTNIGYATTDGGQLPSPAASWIPPSEFDDYGFSDEE